MPKTTDKFRRYAAGDTSVVVVPKKKSFEAYFFKQGNSIFAVRIYEEYQVPNVRTMIHDLSRVPMPPRYDTTREWWEAYCAEMLGPSSS